MQADRLPSHRGQHVDASRDYVVREANVAARRQFVGPLPLAGSPGQNRLGIADKAPVVAAAQQVRRTGPMGRRGKLRLVAPITSGETERRSLGSQVPGGAPIARSGKFSPSWSAARTASWRYSARPGYRRTGTVMWFMPGRSRWPQITTAASGCTGRDAWNKWGNPATFAQHVHYSQGAALAKM
jgi:hypothetical protein